MIGLAIAVGLILLFALILASFLQIASRIVCGESVEFGDAYKTAFCGMMLSAVVKTSGRLHGKCTHFSTFLPKHGS